MRIRPWAGQDAVSEPEAALRLVRGLQAGESWALPALVETHAAWVRRILIRVLGNDGGDHAELVQEVFVRAWRGIERLEKAESLRAWLASIAVFVARAEIRGRRRRRWLTFTARPPEPAVRTGGPELEAAAEAVYAVFDRMPPDERIPFALHKIEGLGLVETAAACGVSLSTVRRRLAQAQRRFFKLARAEETLAPWLEGWSP